MKKAPIEMIYKRFYNQEFMCEDFSYIEYINLRQSLFTYYKLLFKKNIINQ